MSADVQRDQLVAALAGLPLDQWGSNREAARLRAVHGDGADRLLPLIADAEKRAAARALTDFAALIDRGPTFPMPPSVFSAMARERADDEGTGR